MDRSLEVVVVTDPGSPWAWGLEPALRLLEWRFGDRSRWRYVLTGIENDAIVAGDADRSTPDPRTEVDEYVEALRRIHVVTQMPYPTSLRSMWTSTHPACMAVKAAGRQRPDLGQALLRRLREWFFVLGEPFDNKVALVAASSGIEGLDIDRYVADLDAPETLVAFQADWEEARRPNAAARNVDDERPGHGRVVADGNRWRYGLPTVILRGPAGERTVAGFRPVDEYLDAVVEVAPEVGAAPRPLPTGDEVLAHWGTVTDHELALLIGPRGDAPTDAVAHDWGGGVLFAAPHHARALGLEPAG